MKSFASKVIISVLTFFVLMAPLVLANSNEEHESEGLELSVISGLVLFVSLISTVIVAFLMKKGKASMKTHHTLAFVTVVLALFHGIYNLLTH